MHSYRIALILSIRISAALLYASNETVNAVGGGAFTPSSLGGMGRSSHVLFARQVEECEPGQSSVFFFQLVIPSLTRTVDCGEYCCLSETPVVSYLGLISS